jgi:hypothetical protein
MQRTHNALAKDFETLYIIAKESITDAQRIKPLIRSCIKELFSLIESDLYLLNENFPYKDYSDRDRLNDNFKNTYRHFADKFKKNEVRKVYQSRPYRKLYAMKLKRDEFMHPKGPGSIDVDIVDLEEAYTVFSDYRRFILKLHTNVGVRTTIPFF